MKEIRRYPDFVLFLFYIVAVISIFVQGAVPGGYHIRITLFPFIANTLQIF